MTLYPVILAGGSGTRLWPLSRENHPKQFLPLAGEQTMLQQTLLRLRGRSEVAPPLIVCNEAHRFLAAEQARQAGVRPHAIIVEPVGRSTAPALTLASLRLVDLGLQLGEDPLMLVMPADGVIGDLQAFLAAVDTGAALGDGGAMVTFGVPPASPETGYGYVRRGQTLTGPSSRSSKGLAYELSAFVEKPDAETAREYVASGEYMWNSGMFMMRSSVWFSELERLNPEMLKACRASLDNAHQDGDFYRPGAADFIACPADSIDYAVMEKAMSPRSGVAHMGRTSPSSGPQYAVVPLDAGWSDLGAWSALWENRTHDPHGNVVQGDVYAQDTRDSLLVAEGRLLATVGVEDLVVVETADAVLVAKKGRVGEVKDIVTRLKADGRTEHESHRKVHRPWGAYEIVDQGEGFQVKRLTVTAGAALSLQMHRQRTEHWVVVKGTAKVTRGEEVFLLEEDQSTYVEMGMTHRLENPGETPLEIIEVQSGTYLGEDDIVRFQDDYNRHSDG